MNNSTPEFNRRPARPWIVGAMLIVIGVLLLAAQLFPFNGLYFLPLLATIFLAWGLLSRTTGLLVPGGVLAGIGTAAILIEGPFAAISDPAKGGIFFLTFAAGWLLIMLLSIITEPGHKMVWWPIWPAGGMILFGGLLLAGEPGLKGLEWLSKGWPVALIIVGLYLALRRRDLKE